MFRKTFHIVVWLLVVLAVEYALCQEPLPILELDTPDEADKIQHSECVNGVVSDLDLFTVRGRINKNGSNSYVDTNLYLQAAIDPITNNWESQCRPDLTVCGVNLNKDCYCERKDQDGYYHLVMKIVVKSIYSGGKLRLSWNDNRSPQNSPITSNIVDYYPGSIREREYVTLEIRGTNGMILDKNLTHGDTKTIPVTYTPEMRNVTFCVLNLATNRFIQIEDGGDILVFTTTDPCVVLDLSETSSSRNLTITFKELEDCEREGLYILTLEPGKESDGLEIPWWGIIKGLLYISIPFVLLFGICAVSKAVSVKKDCRRYRTTGYKQSKKQKRNPYVSKPFYESSVFTVDTELYAVETNPNANKETSPNANIEMSPKANKETSPNANKETDPDANKEANPNANKETNLNPNKKINPNANKEMNPNANRETDPNANKGTNPNVNKEMNPNANKETNSNANKETNSNANKEMNPNANRETDPNANKETNSNANKEMNPNANRETDPNANNRQIPMPTNR